jgi:hypothetical protein
VLPDAVIEETGVIGKDLGSEDVDPPSVRECLESHSQPLSDTDLTEMEQRRACDEKEGEGCVSKEILVKELEQMFRNMEHVKQKIMDLDPNVERSMLISRTLEKAISCCPETYEEKKKATSVQTTPDKYFSRK